MFPQSRGFSSDRSIGNSLDIAANCSANLLIGTTYLSLMVRSMPSGGSGLYLGGLLLHSLFGVRESKKLHKLRMKRRPAAVETGQRKCRRDQG
jgi:MFS transporter, SP family, solute carrier family 2 (myo-inositol transporter), member 13